MQNAYNLGKNRDKKSSLRGKLLFFWVMLTGAFRMRKKSSIGPAATLILSGAELRAKRYLEYMRLKQIEFSDVWRQTND